jgi:hypothetical protein
VLLDSSFIFSVSVLVKISPTGFFSSYRGLRQDKKYVLCKIRVF